MEMTLRQKRVRFTHCLALLLHRMFMEGYEVAIDEATEHLTKRDPTSDHGASSMHHIGLAEDLNLYKDGKYLSMTEDHKRFGEFWESLDPNLTWGGRFEDGNHYSYGEGRS